MSVLCHTICFLVMLSASWRIQHLIYFDIQHIIKETLNPPTGGQGDVRFMMHNGYTKNNYIFSTVPQDAVFISS